MSGPKGMITLQCGNYSNFVGSHFWNLQESSFVYGTNKSEQESEIDHDVLYREGLTTQKEITYTPRLITVDLKGSLGLLPEFGDLYERPCIPRSDSILWAGDSIIRKEEAPKKNDFLRELDNYENDGEDSDKDIDSICADERLTKGDSTAKLYDLNGQVKYWSDYLSSRFHPKTNVIVNSYQQGNASNPFDVFGMGKEVWEDMNQEVSGEVEDRVRGFAEECDNLEGFQLIADITDGFGGLSTSLIQLLSDDYRSKSLLSFPVSRAVYQDYTFPRNGLRMVGAVLSLAGALESDLVTPMSLGGQWFPLSGKVRSIENVEYDPSSDYHTSGVLALALDTCSLPWRKKGGEVRSAEVVQGIGACGRKIAALGVKIPLPISKNLTLEETLSTLTPTTPLLASHSPQTPPDVSVLSVRGLANTKLCTREGLVGQYRGCSSAQDVFSVWSKICSPRTLAVSTVTKLPASVAKPFPHIFKQEVDEGGEVLKGSRRSDQGVKSVPMMTSWETGRDVGTTLRGLAAQAARIKLDKLHRMREAGLEEEEWNEAVEVLATLGET